MVAVAELSKARLASSTLPQEARRTARQRMMRFMSCPTSRSSDSFVSILRSHEGGNEKAMPASTRRAPDGHPTGTEPTKHPTGTEPTKDWGSYPLRAILPKGCLDGRGEDLNYVALETEGHLSEVVVVSGAAVDDHVGDAAAGGDKGEGGGGVH